MSRAFRGVARLALGMAISGVSVFLVLQVVDLEEAALHLGAASWPVLGLALVGIWADVLLRAVRWQLLLRPIAHISLVRVTRYLLVGYLANNVLPARVGELVRAHYVGDRERVSRASVVGTIVVERALDVMGLVFIGFIAWWLTGMLGAIQPLLAVGLVVSVAAGGVIWGMPLIQRVRVARRFADRGHRGRRLATGLGAGLAVVRSRQLVFRAGVLTLLAWIATGAAFQAASASLALQLSPAEIMMVVAGVNLATAIPSAPGYVGTFELAAVAIAGMFGADPTGSFAVAVLVHAAILVSTTIGGIVAMHAVGVRWSALAAETAAEPTGPAWHRRWTTGR